MGRDALELICPECKEIGSCDAVKTLEYSAYQFKGFFENLNGKESNFRLRVRQCRRCYEEFRTVEIDETVLNFIKEKLDSANLNMSLANQYLNYATSHLTENGSLEQSSNKVERYIRFVFKLCKSVTSENNLNEYFQNNNSDLFVSLVNEILEVLPYKEQKIIEMRFGIGNSDSEHNRSVIGKSLSGIKEKQVQKLEDEGFERLKENEKINSIYEFLEERKLFRGSNY